VPDEPVRIRPREADDLELCVRGLAAVFRDGGYPTNWPADPGGWLSPDSIAGAWVASTEGLPVAGHVLLLRLSGEAAEVSRLFVVPAARRRGVAQALLRRAIDWAMAHELDLVLDVTDHSGAAQALYEQAGFYRAETGIAGWTAPDGQPVTLHRYVRSRG
jgi:ribosomal protein S18 acetylase RimI-like enzyme